MVIKKIGVFDSGLGGLTVVRALQRVNVGCEILYLGDTARVPYGTKSAKTIITYAQKCAEFLSARHADMIVIACNTAAAHATDVLSSDVSVPVIGVIDPGATSAVAATRSGRIGVLATPSTVRSGAYQNAIEKLNPEANVICNAAPLLVPLIEEGWLEGEVPTRVIKRYLSPLLTEQIDTLVLGCTHYPLISPLITTVLQEEGHGEIQIVDSATATAAAVLARVGGGENAAHAALSLAITDHSPAFEEVARLFLADKVNAFDVVDLV